jgi:hypothetical protein
MAQFVLIDGETANVVPDRVCPAFFPSAQFLCMISIFCNYSLQLVIDYDLGLHSLLRKVMIFPSVVKFRCDDASDKSCCAVRKFTYYNRLQISGCSYN